jgi:hypothetical protein
VTVALHPVVDGPAEAPVLVLAGSLGSTTEVPGAHLATIESADAVTALLVEHLEG